MIAAFLTLISRWQFKAGAYVVVALAGLWAGLYIERTRWEALTARTERAIIAQVQENARFNEKIVTEYVTKTKVIRERIEQEPIYVTIQDDAACTVPVDFVRMWNNTNAATDPGPTWRRDDPADTLIHP